jgi:hypothetical protein
MAEEQVNPVDGGGQQQQPTTAADRVSRALAGGAKDSAASGTTTPGDDKGGKDAATVTAAQPGKDVPEGWVSRADVEKMVQDGIKTALDSSQKEAAAADTRSRFLIQNMADIPVGLHALMPKTGDVNALKKAEQEVRGELQAWAKKAGFKTPEVGGNPAGGGGALPYIDNRTPGAKVQSALSKLSPA